MNKGFLVSILSMLAVASLVFGQSPPLPSALPEEVPLAAPPATPGGSLMAPYCYDPNLPRPWSVTVGGEYLLMFVQTERFTPTLAAAAFCTSQSPCGGA